MVVKASWNLRDDDGKVVGLFTGEYPYLGYQGTSAKKIEQAIQAYLQFYRFPPFREPLTSENNANQAQSNAGQTASAAHTPLIGVRIHLPITFNSSEQPENAAHFNDLLHLTQDFAEKAPCLFKGPLCWFYHTQYGKWYWTPMETNRLMHERSSTGRPWIRMSTNLILYEKIEEWCWFELPDKILIDRLLQGWSEKEEVKITNWKSILESVEEERLYLRALLYISKVDLEAMRYLPLFAAPFCFGKDNMAVLEFECDTPTSRVALDVWARPAEQTATDVATTLQALSLESRGVEPLQPSRPLEPIGTEAQLGSH